jgi:hypothetical protein
VNGLSRITKVFDLRSSARQVFDTCLFSNKFKWPCTEMSKKLGVRPRDSQK